MNCDECSGKDECESSRSLTFMDFKSVEEFRQAIISMFLRASMTDSLRTLVARLEGKEQDRKRTGPLQAMESLMVKFKEITIFEARRGYIMIDGIKLPVSDDDDMEIVTGMIYDHMIERKIEV